MTEGISFFCYYFARNHSTTPNDFFKIGWKTKKNDNFFKVIDIFLHIFLFKSLWKCDILLLER